MQNAKGSRDTGREEVRGVADAGSQKPSFTKRPGFAVSILCDEGRILVSGQVEHQSCCEESCEKDGLAYRGILAGSEATVSLPHPETGRVSGICQTGKAEQAPDSSGL